MGLGKTLTVLSTIIRTAKIARSYSEQNYSPPNDVEGRDLVEKGSALIFSRATLVIVPSPCTTYSFPASISMNGQVLTGIVLIDGWVKEIEWHVLNLPLKELTLMKCNSHCYGSLSVKVYHGRGRDIDPKSLADWDIVLSTYHTVAAEAFEAECPLDRISWFRIVLDEGEENELET